MGMHEHMHAHSCTSKHAHMHAHMHAHTHGHMHARALGHMHVHTQKLAHLHRYVHTCLSTPCMPTCMHRCTCMHAHRHACAGMHARPHTHRHACTGTHLRLVPPIITVAVSSLLLMWQQRRCGRRAHRRHWYCCFCMRSFASALAFTSRAEVLMIQTKKLAPVLVCLAFTCAPRAFAWQCLCAQ